jgi:hypothetical protein
LRLAGFLALDLFFIDCESPDDNRKLNVVFLPFLTIGPKPATVACLYSETGLSRPEAAAALAIPDRAALIFSAYCNGILGDFHPPA